MIIQKSNLYLVGALFGLVLWMGNIGYGIGEAIAQSEISANYITFYSKDGNRVTVDLNNDEQVAKFREMYGSEPSVASCLIRADNAVGMMRERDAGVTQQEHLDKVRAQYEKTKSEPQGAIPWHIYLDVGRMVRDVHRLAGQYSKSKYRYTDSRELWSREFKWCALPGERVQY